MIVKLLIVSAFILAPGLFVVIFSPRRYCIGRVMTAIGVALVGVCLILSFFPREVAGREWNNPAPISTSATYTNLDAALTRLYDSNESLFNAVYMATVFGLLILSDRVKWSITDRRSRTKKWSLS